MGEECAFDDCDEDESVVLSNFYERSTTLKQNNVTVHGFKWQQGQGGFKMNGKGARDEAWLKELLKNGFKFILLTREVSLGWFLSAAKMHSGSKTHCETGDDDCLADLKNTKAALRACDLNFCCDLDCSMGEALTLAEANWNEMIDWLTERIPADRFQLVKYEQLMDDTRGQMGDLQRFLGMAPHNVKTSLAQNEHTAIRESVTDYDEVLAEVRGTKWEAEALEGEA